MFAPSATVYDRLPFRLTHGSILNSSKTNLLPFPDCTYDGTDQLSRPDMKNNTGVTKSEFQDSIEAMSIKADVFIDIMKRSKNFSILMGAGISAPLINDYASKKAGQQPAQRLTYEFTRSLRPTPAHRVLAALVNQGHMKLLDVLQQNHDGLLNLAGLGVTNTTEKSTDGKLGVKSKINEIHGAWYDKENPVVPMDGNLRSDLFERMLHQEKQQDCCLTCGTSLAGLNADRLIKTANKKSGKPGQCGGIILSIQQVPQEYEDGCALRIYAKCDDFMLMVAHKLNLKIDWDTDYDYVTEQAISKPVSLRHRTTLEGIETLKRYAQILSNNNNALQADAAVPNAAAASSSSSSNENFQIMVGNRHELKTSGDKNSHQWTMFVRVTKKRAVKSVTFHLHPTFNPPAVRVSEAVDASDNRYPDCEEFTLSRLGWGTFEVKVEIELNDGSNTKKVLTATHDLQFEQPEAGSVVYQQ